MRPAGGSVGCGKTPSGANGYQAPPSQVAYRVNGIGGWAAVGVLPSWPESPCALGISACRVPQLVRPQTAHGHLPASRVRVGRSGKVCVGVPPNHSPETRTTVFRERGGV